MKPNPGFRLSCLRLLLDNGSMTGAKLEPHKTYVTATVIGINVRMLSSRQLPSENLDPAVSRLLVQVLQHVRRYAANWTQAAISSDLSLMQGKLHARLDIHVLGGDERAQGS